MSDPREMSDGELREELRGLGFDSGPVIGSTRSVMEKKFLKLRDSTSIGTQSNAPRVSTSAKSTKSQGNLSRVSIPTKSPKPQVNTILRRKSTSEMASGDSKKKHSSTREESFVNRVRSTEPTRPNREENFEHRVRAIESTFPKREESFVNRVRLNETTRPNREENFVNRARVTESTRPKREESFVNRVRLTESIRPNREENFENGVRVTESTRPNREENFENGVRVTELTRPKQAPTSNDLPKWLTMIFGAFTVVLTLAYVFTAHTKTVVRTNRLITASILGTANFVYNYTILPILISFVVIGLLIAVFLIYTKRETTRKDLERRTAILVDQVADRVRDAGDSGVAEQHLRDELFPPTRRTVKDMKLWNNVASFINNMDSRIRSESHLINGVECNVWVWVNLQDIRRKWKVPSYNHE